MPQRCNGESVSGGKWVGTLNTDGYVHNEMPDGHRHWDWLVGVHDKELIVEM